ncbi:MAG: hypothetical protein ABSE66_09135 [Thermoplasmata archaeon]|jgi:hypothetical protein
MADDTAIAIVSPPKRKRKGGEGNPDLKEIGGSLGIVFSPQDVFYLLLTGVDVLQNQASLSRKARLYASLLDRMVPDTEFTRRRVARLLQGLEALSRSLRVILTLDDFDLLGEFKSAMIDALQEVADSADKPGKAGFKIELQRLTDRLKVVSERLSDHPDPRVQNALVVLSKMGTLLDVTEDFPELPSVDDIDLKAFEPASKRRHASSR